MNRTLKWGLALAALLVLCIIIRLPATLVAQAALPDSIKLAGVHGSVWSGSANALGINGVAAQEKIKWQLLGKGLLHGRLEWLVTGDFNDLPSSLNAAAGFTGVSVSKLRLNIPLEPLMHFNPTVEGIHLHGTLTVEADRLAPHAPVKARIRARQVSTSMGTEPALLGSYDGSVELDTASGKGKLQLNGQGGPLQIRGGGAFHTSGKGVDIKLLLHPLSDIPVLSPILATLPREKDQFVFKIKRR